jgi:hypothetical protein
MDNKKVTVFIVIHKGFIEEVKAFRNHSVAQEYYNKKVLESYESMEQYKETEQSGAKLEFKLYQADLV